MVLRTKTNIKFNFHVLNSFKLTVSFQVVRLVHIVDVFIKVWNYQIESLNVRIVGLLLIEITMRQ